jgi:hypothetical protein
MISMGSEVGVVHERVHGVAGGALDFVLLRDERGEVLVFLHSTGERDDAVHEALVRLEERLAARLVAGVQHGAVHEHDPHILEGVVGVLCHAAAHAGRVVGDDAANHARVDGGRVGAHLVLLLDAVLLLVLGEQAVHLSEDQAGLERDLFALVLRKSGAGMRVGQRGSSETGDRDTKISRRVRALVLAKG